MIRILTSMLILNALLLSGCMNENRSLEANEQIGTQVPLNLQQDSPWGKAVTNYILRDARNAHYLASKPAWVLNRDSLRVLVGKRSTTISSGRIGSISEYAISLKEPKLESSAHVKRVVFQNMRAQGNTVSLSASGTLEQTWTNGPDGIEQTFRVYESVGSDFQIRIPVQTGSDWKVDSSGLHVLSAGKQLLSASAPRAFDSDGSEIRSYFERQGDDLVIVVRGARNYPVLIDPAWQASGESPQSSWFGWKVKSAGDVNHDGFDDVVVSAPFFNTGNQSAGKIYLYYGNSSGLSATPFWTSSGDDSNRALFGWSVASGDFNGDGYSDLAVGAPSRADTGDTVGKAFVFPGSFNGPLPAVWTSSGDGQQGAFFGTSIACAGDTNGDGFDDLLVGAPAASMTGGESSLPGKAFLFAGSSSGPSSSAAWTSEGDSQAGAGFGWSVASAGDVDADGFDDIAVGAHLYDMTEMDSGRVYLYRGSQAFPGNSPTWAESGDVQQGAQFGWSISGGTIDADGFSDLVVSAPGYDAPASSAGRVYAYRGGDLNTGLSSTYWWVNSGSALAGAQFGWSVAIAGDVNDDGYGEVLIGAPADSSAGAGAGKIYLFNGSSAGPLQDASFTSKGDEQAGAAFGGSVARAGDINGDGAADFVVGAYLMDSDGTNSGAAFLFLGTPGGGPGVCEPEGADCDDHDDCTSSDKCDANGQCHGIAFSCDDQNPCTDDVCRPNGTCSFLHNTAPCDDGDPCTSPDVCAGGQCNGQLMDCSWLDDQCNQGTCDPATGQCRPQPVADGTPCDDGDSCTTDEACTAGVCIQGAYTCSDDSGCGCSAETPSGRAGMRLLLLLGLLILARTRGR